MLLVLSVWRGGLNTIAGWLGVTGYPPAVLFAVATLFIFLVLLHYSTVISRLTDENVDLAQRIALLEERLSRPHGHRRAEREDVAFVRVVDPVRPDADPVRRGRQAPICVDEGEVARRRDRLAAHEAVARLRLPER